MIIFSGKSAPPGVLLTHSSVYEFQKCGSNRKGTTVYWSCAEKPATHCRARATTTVSEEEVVNEDANCLLEVLTEVQEEAIED